MKNVYILTLILHYYLVPKVGGFLITFQHISDIYINYILC